MLHMKFIRYPVFECNVCKRVLQTHTHIKISMLLQPHGKPEPLTLEPINNVSVKLSLKLP